MDKGFALSVLKAVLDRGVREAEVYLRTSGNLTIEVRDQRIDTLETSRSMGYSLRVIQDGRLGFSYSTDPLHFHTVIQRALESCQHSSPDPFLSLPGTSRPGAVAVHDPLVASISENQALARVLAMERAARAQDDRIRKVRKASGSFSTNSTWIVNSHGLEGSCASTACTAHLTVVAEDRGESQMGWDFEGSRFLDSVSFEGVGRRAALRALQLLGGRRLSPVKAPVLLDNATACDFLSLLAHSLSAEAVQKKKSMLAGMTGQPVISEALSVSDKGLLDGMLGSKPFDDEGVPTGNRVLIDRGVLRGLLHNTYTASKDGGSSTGNALRGGFSRLPSVGATNLFIGPAPGIAPVPEEALLEELNKGLLVTETMGMHTANPITGEYSVGVSGVWIEGGRTRYPVREAVVSGTVLDLFRLVGGVGADLRFYGNIGSPSLLIEGIDISG